MPVDNIIDQAAPQLNRGQTVPYTRDYVGAVQLLEDSGFSPFGDTSPLSATLNQVFSRFVEKTGLGVDSNTLRDEFLAGNPTTRRALRLYEALENTFSSRRVGEQAAIVDFLNTKIDDFIATKDRDSDDLLALEESAMPPTLFEEADANRDSQLNSEEPRNNFFNNFPELNNVMNYFRSTRGLLVDVFA